MGPPAGTIVLQWNTAVNYITELPLAYIFAMLVVEKKYFDRIQPADQAIVREVMEQVYVGFDEQGEADNKAAYQALLDDGMNSVEPDMDQLDAWYANVQKSNHNLAGDGVVSLDLLLELECHVAAYRASELEKDCGNTAR
jgi:TRAP-type C4-dicarboxylate transport system substrate-binding protein